MEKYITIIVLGVLLIIASLMMNRYLAHKLVSTPVDSVRSTVVKTADGYEPDVIVVSIEDSLFHLTYCGWKGDNAKYMSPKDAVMKGFKPCPHCFGEE